MEIYKNTDLEDLSNEIWKDIEGYEGLYQVSNMGRVKSLERKIKYSKGERIVYEKILKQNTNGRGYLQLYLCKNKTKQQHTVHRLVARAFISNEKNKPCVNHINENKADNRVENLEYCTYHENNIHGTRMKRIAKTQGKPVLQYDLNGNFIREWESIKEAGRNGFDARHISNCCHKRENTHKKYIWKFKEEE